MKTYTNEYKAFLHDAARQLLEALDKEESDSTIKQFTDYMERVLSLIKESK